MILILQVLLKFDIVYDDLWTTSIVCESGHRYYLVQAQFNCQIN